MKLEKMPPEFVEVQPVMAAIKAAGFEAYIVGGSVRDVLLNKPIHDVDIATSAFPEEIKQIFPRTIDVGIQHGTVMVLEEEQQYEITTFRTESTYQDFRRPDEVTFVRSLGEDLKRRDFTINAFAIASDGELIDLFDGLQDLRNKTIRAVGAPQERFHEDALRMMRGLRFASQLEFDLEPQTLAAIGDNHALLGKISVERIQIEFVKLLMGVDRAKGLIPFVETECYIYCPGLRQYGDALLRLADKPLRPLQEEAQAWTMLVHEMGLSRDEIKDFMKEWKCANHLIAKVQLLANGLTRRLTGFWDPLSAYQMGGNIQLVEALLYYYDQKPQLNEAQAFYDALPIHQREELAIDGRRLLTALDAKPGPWLGQLLQEIEEMVLLSQLENNTEAILAFAKER